jgi:hypothetical protein
MVFERMAATCAFPQIHCCSASTSFAHLSLLFACVRARFQLNMEDEDEIDAMVQQTGGAQ